MSHNSPDMRVNPKPQPQLGRVGGIRLSSIDFVRQNPLDVFWRIAIAESYDKERISSNELHLSMPGIYCDHHISLSWSPADEEIQLFLVFEGRIPGGRTDEICRLMSMVNERLAVGHFVYWDKDETLVYRHSMALTGEAKLTADQAMSMLASALSAAERGYPACQYVLWAGMNPEEALNTALMDKVARK